MNLQLEGYFINHKKVYRLMRDHHLLESPRRSSGRDFVKFRRVAPQGPLSVLEMDIKYFYVEQRRGYAFVLTIIDTFTRVVLNWRAGYSIRQEQVKQLWSDVIVNYLQPANLLGRRLDIEIRNDNGKQFSADRCGHSSPKTRSIRSLRIPTRPKKTPTWRASTKPWEPL